MEYVAKELQPVLNEMLTRVTTGLPDDILNAIKEAHAHETKEIAKKQLEAILTSANLSYEGHLPLCQYRPRHPIHFRRINGAFR